jgi:hypothetical protein
MTGIDHDVSDGPHDQQVCVAHDDTHAAGIGQSSGPMQIGSQISPGGAAPQRAHHSGGTFGAHMPPSRGRASE